MAIPGRRNSGFLLATNNNRKCAKPISFRSDWIRRGTLNRSAILFAGKVGRVAVEGRIGVAVAGPKGVVIEVNSETDFVARNEQFQTLVNQIADTALTTSADLDAIKAAKLGNYTVADTIASAIATIGENITLRRAVGLAVGQGVVTGDVHNPAGKIGVIVALESAGKTDELSALGRLVAMHVA
jgi:elongation factor Ts